MMWDHHCQSSPRFDMASHSDMENGPKRYCLSPGLYRISYVGQVLGRGVFGFLKSNRRTSRVRAIGQVRWGWIGFMVLYPRSAGRSNWLGQYTAVRECPTSWVQRPPVAGLGTHTTALCDSGSLLLIKNLALSCRPCRPGPAIATPQTTRPPISLRHQLTPFVLAESLPLNIRYHTSGARARNG